jgi:hypothetical protein
VHSRRIKFRAYGAVKRALDRPGGRHLLGALTAPDVVRTPRS